MAQNISSALSHFEVQIQSIVVKDYGDFRRKANTYFDRLVEDLGDSSSKVQPHLSELKNLIAFTSNGNIEDVKQTILSHAEKLKSELH